MEHPVYVYLAFAFHELFTGKQYTSTIGTYIIHIQEFEYKKNRSHMPSTFPYYYYNFEVLFELFFSVTSKKS